MASCSLSIEVESLPTRSYAASVQLGKLPIVSHWPCVASQRPPIASYSLSTEIGSLSNASYGL